VARLTRDFVADNWDAHPRATGASEPANIELKTEDAQGQARKGVDYTEEYVLVLETGSREQEYVDGPLDVVDPAASCLMEVSTPESRARREELYRELLGLARYARKRRAGAPGGWDTVTLTTATVDDEVFGWWTLEMEWQFEAEARTI
jgi:hypothetical protein